MTTNTFRTKVRVTARNIKGDGKHSIKSKKSESAKPWSVVAGAVTLLSLLGVAGALLGYGVAAATQAKFAIPHETLFTSPFELIELSVAAIMQFFERFSTVELLRDLYGPMVADMLPTTGILAVLWLLIAAAIAFRKRVIVISAWLSAGLKRWVSEKKDQRTPLYNWIVLSLKGLGVVAVILLGMPLAMWAMLMVVLTALFLLSMLPLLGMSSAGLYLDKYVIMPEHCAPLRSRANLMKPGVDKKPQPYAVCVSVENPRLAPAVGRLVFATSSAVVLFDPIKGTVTRVPAKDARITLIDRL